MDNIQQDLSLLDDKILSVKRQRAAIITLKTEKQSKASVLREMLSSTPSHNSDFDKLVEDRRDIKFELSDLEIQINDFNDALRKYNNIRSSLVVDQKKSNNGNDKTINRISSLRDKYRLFAKDHTRVNSMRLMASAFCDELDSIMIKN